MLDETNPADEQATPSTPDATDVAAGTEAAVPAKKAAARKTAAKKTAAKKTTTRKTAAKKTAAAEPAETPAEAAAPAEAPVEGEAPAPAKKAAAKRTRKTAAKKAVADPTPEVVEAAEATTAPPADETAPDAAAEPAPAKKAAARKTAAKKTAAKKTTTRKTAAKKAVAEPAPVEAPVEGEATDAAEADAAEADATGTAPLFQVPEAPAKKAPARRTRKRAATPVVDAVEEQELEVPAEEVATDAADAAPTTEGDEATDEATDGATAEVTEAEAAEQAVEAEGAQGAEDETADEDSAEGEAVEGDADGDGTPARRRRRRGGRRRRRSGGQGDAQADENGEDASEDAGAEQGGDESDSEDAKGDAEASDNGEESEGGSGSSRRRRRRRRSGDSDAESGDDPENTVVRVRKARTAEDQITAVSGSTRLEAKKQRRREGREAGRRRAPIVSEAEFLARREAVERVMVIRQRKELTQIAVLEDKVLVEHYVARESQTSLIGNVYLGRVQNVLPSMEAAFVDIGKGRNAVLYAGEVNWSSLGHKDGQPRKIEAVLSPGQPVLVQVTKDPIGHKGARLTSQISLAGRFLVYVPDGTTSGISRKLPDTERARLKALLKEIVPDSAGVIVRTAAEGASEEELTADVERLKARWEDIAAKKGRGNGPTLLYGEPDLTLKVVRDLFTEDFSKLVVEGEDAWQTVQGYVEHVAPDLADRLEKYEPADNASAQQGDVFSVYRIDEQIAKGLDRKVWLPSGGSLIIDRTEAMTVVDVNTGKFTGSGGNLEETVTKNNLEAAEEIVRQLRLRDIGGIIVVDFIDMVLEANRDLVLRRLVECLGRDRTRHQVAEVTSLGLVQMTRKRIGTGLVETFSHDCEHCQGRGIVTHAHPVESRGGGDDEGRRGRRGRGKGGDKGNDQKGNDQKSNDQKSNDQRNADKGGADKGSEKADGGKGGDDRTESGRGRNRRGGGRDGDRNAPTGTESADAAPVASPIVVAEKAREHAEEQAAATGTPVPEVPSTPAAVTPAPEASEKPASEKPAAEQPAAETGAEPAEAQKPTVVTRTRARRGVSRPTTSTSPVAVAVTVPTPDASAPAEPVVLPEAAAPKVTTRTRGRAAARPSGAPAEGDASAQAGESASEGASETTPETTVEHVPVKKKGARKR